MEKTLSRQYINFHDAVITSIGPYGRAQGYMLVATILLNMFSSWSMVYINFSSDKWHILGEHHSYDRQYASLFTYVVNSKKWQSIITILIFSYEFVKLGANNWERIKKEKANPILIASYKDAITQELPWISIGKLNLWLK